MIFPLPIAPFEEAIIVDERRAYPWSIWFSLKFTGLFDRSRAEQAFRTAFARHPLFTANIFDNGKSKAWKLPGYEVPIRWCSPDDSAARMIPELELRHACPTEVRVIEQGNQSEMLFITHHAICDGAGAFQLIIDFLIEYSRLSGQNNSECDLPPLDASRLVHRADLGLKWWQWVKLAPKLAVGLFGVRQFAMRKPIPLLPHDIFPDETEFKTGEAATVFEEFSPTETNGFRLAAKNLRVTLNDLMIRDVILAIGRFRERRRITTPRDWIRIAVPMNVRSADHVNTPATNVVSMVFIDRLPDQLNDQSVLLQTVVDEMGLIKRNKLAFIWPLCLLACRWLLGGIRRVARNDSCLATALFSNVMTPFQGVKLPLEAGRIRAGNMVLESCDPYGPIRPGMCVSLVAMTYAGRLRLSMHFDSRVLTKDDARELLSGVSSKFRDSMASGGASEPLLAAANQQ